jgi:acetolactate synthase-1/2/3 large subunit/5-guanidino-2-oxopentanoate decarboxylase
LFILGGGAVACADAARKALGALRAASFETYAGRGIMASSTLNFGSYLARPDSADIIASADVVVLVGTEFGETELWRTDAGLSGLTLQVDIDPQSFHPRADHTVRATAQAFFDQLLDALGDHRPDTTWVETDVQAARDRWKQQVASETPHVVTIADALRAALPDETMIFSDMTQFAYAAKEVWPMEQPGFWHHPTGFGTLGYGMPAAIGGALARQGAPTLAIAGDYGFQYSSQELGLAVELGLSLPIILWDNGKLKAIEDSMVRAQIAPNAVAAHAPDFCKLAEAYGARAARPGSLDALQASVADAFSAGVPTLIHVTPDVLGKPV